MRNRRSIQSFFRIIWAIALRDIADAIKNKTILSVLGSVVFTVAMYKFLPYLDSGHELPALLVYDEGQSVLTVQLEESPQLRLYTYDSQEQMQRAVTRADNFELGVVLPADLDRRIEAGENVALEGYAAYWLDDAKTEELRKVFEDELTFYAASSRAAGSAQAEAAIQIRPELHKLYPLNPTVASSGFMVSMAIVLVLTMLGLLIVVHLMIEEKQTQTIDALLVSPASPLQMLLGKAVTGVVYCSIGVLAVYALNAAYITHWGLALCAGLCGALFTVGLGLLLGTIFESRQQLTLWGFLLMNVLLLPMFLVIMDDLLPPAVVKVMRSVPTSVIAWLVRASFPPQVPTGALLARLGYILAWAAGVFALGAWRVRRLER